MKTILVAVLLAGAGFGLGQLARPAPAAVDRAPRLTIYLASVIWQGADGGLNTAAMFCSATDAESAADKMGATFKRKFPGGTVLSIKANPIDDDLIDEVCASRRKPVI